MIDNVNNDIIYNKNNNVVPISCGVLASLISTNSKYDSSYITYFDLQVFASILTETISEQEDVKNLYNKPSAFAIPFLDKKNLINAPKFNQECRELFGKYTKRYDDFAGINEVNFFACAEKTYNIKMKRDKNNILCTTYEFCKWLNDADKKHTYITGIYFMNGNNVISEKTKNNYNKEIKSNVYSVTKKTYTEKEKALALETITKNITEAFELKDFHIKNGSIKNALENAISNFNLLGLDKINNTEKEFVDKYIKICDEKDPMNELTI